MNEPEVWSVAARTGERVRAVASTASPADVDAAVRAAHAAAPALAGAGPVGRIRLLAALADALEADADGIVETADTETALGEARLRGELARSAFQFRHFAEVLADGGYLGVTIDHRDPGAAPAPRPDLRRMLVPLGPVGVFAAGNFPLAFSVAGGDVASALAAGCPVVVKAHPGHPGTSERCADLLRSAARSAGFPADALGLVHGWSAGADLVTHPLVRAVGFTGSVSGGRTLFDLACARPEPIPFFGELGSVNPVVVTPAAAAERAEDIGTGLAGSVTLGAGQFCTKPGLVFVPAGADGARLVDVLTDAVGRVPEAPMLTASIRDGFLAGATSRAARPGVRVVPADPAGAAPRVLIADPDSVSDDLVEECFGPLVVVVPYAGETDLFAALDRVPGSLTATVHAGRSEGGAGSLADRVVGRITGRAGRVVFDGYPTGVAVTWATHHGGPYPASTAEAHTSVGAAAIARFLRPVVYQDAPADLLPPELRDDNPLGLPRRVDGRYQPPA